MATRTVVTCDICDKEIDDTELYFNAGSYGIETHLICLKMLRATELIVLLGLDDTKIMAKEGWQEARKANSYFRTNP